MNVKTLARNGIMGDGKNVFDQNEKAVEFSMGDKSIPWGHSLSKHEFKSCLEVEACLSSMSQGEHSTFIVSRSKSHRGRHSIFSETSQSYQLEIDLCIHQIIQADFQK